MSVVLAEFLAGALGSVVTKCVIYPLETLRIILAVHSRSRHGNDGESSLRRLTLLRSFNGLVVSCLDSALYNGVSFSGYLYLKQVWKVPMPPCVALASGMLAGSVASLFAMPLQSITVKQRASSATQRPLSFLAAAAGTIADDGVAGLWRGYKAGLYMTVDPAIVFVLFDLLQKLASQAGLPASALATFFFGLVAKSVAVTCTYPLALAQANIQAVDTVGLPPPRPYQAGCMRGQSLQLGAVLCICPSRRNPRKMA
jgi:hypothetical protein